ncbi:MAG TPA: type II toxin-antitoxin system prevent-host-death family antitoxin [Terriglobales bacterium]|nr:type II toxin-antitoxin system prevent-host-death family antitoxin [Terriglobales bacterium]
MEIIVSATEANRKFSEILRGVRDGRSYVITSHGEAVARIVPSHWDNAERRRREAAGRTLLEHLRAQPIIEVGPLTRDDAYDQS